MNRNSIIYKIAKKCENPGDSSFWKPMHFVWIFVIMQKGECVYKRIRKQYQNETILYTHSVSNGDYFIFKCFMDSAFKYNSIKLYCTPCETGVYKFVSTFNYQNIIPLSSIDYISLVFYLRYMGAELNSFNIAPWTLTDYYASVPGKLDVKLIYPPGNNKAIEDFFIVNNLKIKQTVILAPYEQTISLLKKELPPVHFWENLADRLKNKGFSVCTNCSNTTEEPTINGTVPYFCPFDNIATFAEKAGYIIGIRSGFMDIISLTDTKKIVLYPDSDFYETFSLKHIFGSETNVNEYVYDNSSFDTIIERICNELEA